MFSVKINVKVLLHIDVNGGLLPTGSSTDLIAVISLCATFYSLGYVRGKHDAKTEKDRPTLRK